MIGFETSDLKKRRKVDFYNHVAARHHTGVHDVGFGATVKISVLCMRLRLFWDLFYFRQP